LIVYADSSFLVSLYVHDLHSPDALAKLRTSPTVVITPFHRAEIANALQQCVFSSALTEFEGARAWKRFEGDLKTGFQVVTLPESAWETSISLSRRFCATLGVRTLDTLHVASALELRADAFWTFDDRQIRLAQAAGLDTSA
jgi:predicted nucleic acid-binding protein